MKYVYSESVCPNLNQKTGYIELALTAGRHQIKSIISGEVISRSIFPHSVDEVMNLESHIDTFEKTWLSLDPSSHYIVYLSGLTILVQAVYIAWLRSCVPSGDTIPRRLIFAHYDRQLGSYQLFCAFTGEKIKPSDLKDLS
jgi:hypothetical protein